MVESSHRAVALSNFATAKNRSRRALGPRRRKFFRVIAKHAYPRQTAYEIRCLTKERYGERTIYDWIAGRSEAPLAVCIQIMGEILSE